VFSQKSRSFAVAGRDASCLSVASILQYVKGNLLLLVTSASDLPMRINKLFCSLLFVVVVHAAGCDKKIHRCVASCAVNCMVDGVVVSPVISQLFVENRDFCLPHLHSRPLLRGSPSEYRHKVRYTKTRMVWLPDGEKSLIVRLLCALSSVISRHTCFSSSLRCCWLVAQHRSSGAVVTV